MKRYLRTFRRHKLLVVAPLVLALLIGLGYEFASPRHYLAQGTLWADTPVPQSSTVFSQSQASQSPAAQESSILSELMSTDHFLADIGRRSPWAAYLRLHPGALNTVFASLRKQTTVSVLGPQVISVAYQSSDAATTAPMARAIMNAFVAELMTLQRTRDEQQIAYDKQTEQTTLNALNSQQQQLSQYLAAHPQSPGATVDPTVTQLSGNVANAEQLYGTAVSNLNTAQLNLASAKDSSQLHVIDQPANAFVQGRKKAIAYAGIGALFAGGIISILLLSFLVSRDTSAWDADDVENELGLTVVGSVEQLPARRRQVRGAL
jgi:capsular polysaccharide biosynthesis protein